MSAAVYPDLEGRAVLVTGGADGIGRATVEAFASQGARVAFLDRAEATGRALAGRLRDEGRDVAFAPVDLRDVAATRAAIAALRDATGPFTICVNNAGDDRRHAFAALTPEAWDDGLAVNLRPMMFVARAVAPDMATAGGGAVVNLGSTSWMKGAVDLIAYTTAKAAILGFTRSLARELGPSNIRVNCVTPGWVMTERQRRERLTPERWEAAQAQQAIKGAIEPADVANLVLFLASDAARMCTGQNFIVDGGTV